MLGDALDTYLYLTQRPYSVQCFVSTCVNTLQMFGQLFCKHQDGQLALVVGESHVITFLCIQVAEVDLSRCMDYTGDIDDSTRGRLNHQIQQGHGQ